MMMDLQISACSCCFVDQLPQLVTLCSMSVSLLLACGVT